MKTTRKLAALLAVASLLLTLWAPLSVSAEQPALTVAEQPTETPFYFGRSVLAQMENGEALCYAYDRLVAGSESLSKTIDISHRTHRIDSNEASLVWQAVTADHPELFWLADGMSMQGSPSCVTAFVPHLYDGIRELRIALQNRVAELTADLADKSDYEKSLILHDRVCDAVVYQFSAHDQTVVGSLLEGASVCAGYARAYQLLMQTVGIPVFIVTGYSRGENHAWNLVQLDGEWYYTDVTWDDQNDQGGHVFYAYLNLTFDRMEEDHTFLSFVEYLPKSTATAANYHVKNGTLMAEPDIDIIAALYRSGGIVRVGADGSVNDFLSALNQRMGELVTAIACPYSGCQGSFAYNGHEIILMLTVTKPHVYKNHSNTCSDCGYTFVADHHYEVSVVEPTCTQMGKTTYTCTLCGDNYFEMIPALGHDYDAVVTAPNCEQGGYTTYTCAVCGDSYVGDHVDAAGHHYDKTVTNPTCDTPGKAVYTCAVCGDSYTEAIPAPGHNYVPTVTAPDCEHNGYTTYTCSACGGSYIDALTDPLGHNYVPKVTAPDCEHGGYTTYTCSACGGSYIDALTDPFGHNYVPVVTAPDCEHGGYTTYTCTACGGSYVSDTTAALGHHYVPVVTVPDCEHNGYTTYVCSACGGSYVSDPTAALGHHYESVVTAPTCSADGETLYTCTHCGDSYAEVIPATGHDMTWWQDDTHHKHYCLTCGLVADHSEHAYIGNTCQACGHTKAEEILYGDANRDGKVNNKDLAGLQQYLADWDVTIDTVACDVNCDGKVNNKDLARLQQYLADWDVTLG
ncbi:MAG: hypothetical protein IJB36_04805 [Clostridia bacterium]|nr:hypothetical protein [Clostridia bacterium]